MSDAATYVTVTAGLCLMMASWSDGGVGDATADAATTTADGDGPRSRRFVVVNGEGVPDYDDVDDYDPGHDSGGGGGGGGGGHDYDGWYPDIDLDDDDHHHGHDHDHDDDDFDFDFDHHDGPGYHHHVWWHHFYHHDEPHLPFPLFPPYFVHRLRPVYRRRRGCSDWPFVCRSTYEVVQWLQCYHEFLGGSHVTKLHRGVPVVPVHAWKKK